MAVHASQSRPVLLTRPRAGAERFGAALPGLRTIISPLIEIAGLEDHVTLDGYSGVIFTSENAIEFIEKASIPAFCIGPRTTAVAMGAGSYAEQCGHDAEGLVANLLQRKVKGPLLHPHGLHVRGNIAGSLTLRGLNTKGIAVYDQRARKPDDLFHAALSKPGLVVPLFSPRSAKLFADAVPRVPRDAIIVAFSENVALALPKDWASQVRTVSRPDLELMREAVQTAALRPISP